MKKLISMTEYVIWISEEPITEIGDWRSKRFYNIRSYAQFLQTTPQLSDLVPCNKEGEPMEKPLEFDVYKETLESGSKYDSTKPLIVKCKEYQKALDACIFNPKELSLDELKEICNGQTIEEAINKGIPLYGNEKLRRELGFD